MNTSGINTALPPKTVLIQDGTISINDEESSATLKKDDQLNIREIQMQETAIVTGAVGVTVIIPEDTKIFSPEEVKTEPVITEVAPVVTTGETFIATGSNEPSISEIITTDTGLTAEIISSSFSELIEKESALAPAAAFLGQAPLRSDTLTIENNTVDQVEWP
ncbi:hypothetical protein KBC03_07335 [Patescibacteria group bacterium]|nr:hypothetical protein [Patescibacteria group bacterium]